MRHPATLALFAHWTELRGERSAPERAEIDPTAIRQFLADTFILEADEPAGFPIRLAGTRVSALFCTDLKGHNLATLWWRTAGPEGAREITGLARMVCDDAAGVVAGVSARTRGGQALELELILLPLRHRGRTHARILGALSPASVPYWQGLDPVEALEIRTMRVIPPAAHRDVEVIRSEPPRPSAMRRGHLCVYEGGRSSAGGQFTPER